MLATQRVRPSLLVHKLDIPPQRTRRDWRKRQTLLDLGGGRFNRRRNWQREACLGPRKTIGLHTHHQILELLRSSRQLCLHSAQVLKPLSLSQSCVPGAASGAGDAKLTTALRMGTWWGACRLRPGLRAHWQSFSSKTTSPGPSVLPALAVAVGLFHSLRTSSSGSSFLWGRLPGTLLFSVWSVSRRRWGGLGLKHAEQNCQSLGPVRQEKAQGTVLFPIGDG